jgi:hypothetical protein
VDDFKNLRQEVLDLEKANREQSKELEDLKKQFEAKRTPANQIPFQSQAGQEGASASGNYCSLIDWVTRHGLVTAFAVRRVGRLYAGVFNADDVMVMAGLAVLSYDRSRPKQTGIPQLPEKTQA